jgi:hypothetical protein
MPTNEPQPVAPTTGRIEDHPCYELALVTHWSNRVAVLATVHSHDDGCTCVLCLIVCVNTNDRCLSH